METRDPFDEIVVGTADHAKPTVYTTKCGTAIDGVSWLNNSVVNKLNEAAEDFSSVVEPATNRFQRQQSLEEAAEHSVRLVRFWQDLNVT